MKTIEQVKKYLYKRLRESTDRLKILDDMGISQNSGGYITEIERRLASISILDFIDSEDTHVSNI